MGLPTRTRSAEAHDPQTTPVLAGLALALLSCRGPEPERLTACADGDCQVRWAEAHFLADPPGVMAEIAALPDPIAQGAVLDALVKAHPDQVRHLCGALSAGPARARCEALNDRPHLWQVAEKESAEEGQSAPLGLIPGLVPAEAALVRWEQLSPEQIACPSEAATCQTEAAGARAAAGDATGVAAACLFLEDPTARDECFFQAAERAGASSLATGVPLGARLCLSAPRFASQCLLHLTWSVASQTPNASAGEAAAWQALRTGIEGAAAQIAAGDAEVASTWASRAWANALRAAYERESPVTGVPLDHLPTELAPYITCAAAWRLWNLEAQQPRALAAWGERVASALASREGPVAPNREAHRVSLVVKDLWEDVLPGEESLTRISWLGGSTRAVAADARGDALVCILEVAARDRAPRVDLLAEGLRDADPVVRWTATRLLTVLRAPEGKLAAARRDTDPRVRGRARKAGSKL